MLSDRHGSARSLLPRRPRGVVFDKDGLLLDTETLYRDAHKLACAARGLRMDDQLYGTLIGMPEERAEERLLGAFGTALDLPRYHEDCARHFDELCAGRSRCVPASRFC